jgi:glucose-6-phosphate 1-epimerase
MQTIESLNNEFGISSIVRFEAGAGGLTRAVVTSPLAEAHIYMHGAHVTHFQPTGQKPVLFLSEKSVFAAGKAIRGGVPICFPWFGAKQGDPKAPSHGPARISLWTVESVAQLPGGEVKMVFGFENARFCVTVGAALKMALEVRNTQDVAFQFEEALHTYLAVSDARNVQVAGLAGTDYLDKADGFKSKTQGREAFRIEGETNRIYINTASTCVVTDRDWSRRLVVEKSGSNVTVVWNPWTTQTPSLPDFGADEWQRMLCIETANVIPQPLTLPPGQSHTITATVRVVAI